MSEPTLTQVMSAVMANNQAMNQRFDDLHTRLFDEGPDGGAIGKLTKVVESKADQKDFDALKIKVDGLTWKAAWSSGVMTGLAFAIKYSIPKLFGHH